MSNDNGIDIDQVVDDPPSIDIETSSASAIRLQTSEDYNSLEEVGLLPYEDIAWDLGRLEVKVDPTPSPTTPSPTTPSPTTPRSPTPSPQGTIVVPASPVPAPPTTLTPTLSSNDSETPTATATTTNTAVPTGTSYSPTTYYSPTTSPTITVTVNDEIVVVANVVQTQTYYYCPPPPAKTIEARDTNGKNVVITIPPPVSSVVIDYTFQVQLNNNEVVMNGDGSEDDDGIIIMEDLLPQIQDRVGDSLGEYYSSRGQDNKTNGNENETNDVDASSTTTCGGYFVDDFRRRKLLLMNARTRRKNMANANEEDVQTRIIGVSSTENLTVDKDKPCVPRNKGCYVVQGEFEATYVGYNEAGVKSSISRAVKEEMVHGSGSSSSQASSGPEGEYEYNLQFLGTQDEEVGHTQTADSSIFSKLIGQWKEVLPETTEQKPTPYGMAILGVLGATFLVLCYVVFVKSDGAEKVKDQIMKDRKEKRGAKKRALGEMSNQHHHSLENSSDYCYDLESVAIIDDDHHGTSSNGTYGGGEESTGVEVRSTRDLFGRNSAKVASAGGGVVAASVQSKDGSRDSDKTKRISNRAGANASNYVGLQQLGSLIEVEESNSSNYGGGSNSSTSSLHVGPRQVSALDAGMSVHDSDDDVSSIGMTNFPPRKLSNKNNNTENDCTRRIIDRTPSCVTSATTTRASPVPTVNSQQIFQLPSISEAELAPPMNDTPRHHSSRMSTNLEVREQSGETSDESQEFEV